MSFTVRLDREVIKRLDRIDRATEKRIRARITDLALDPMDPRLSAPLQGPGDLRMAKVGLWRIVFTVDVAHHTLDVLLLEPRGQVYGRL